jgi:hypothetical protein
MKLRREGINALREHFISLVKDHCEWSDRFACQQFDEYLAGKRDVTMHDTTLVILSSWIGDTNVD